MKKIILIMIMFGVLTISGSTIKTVYGDTSIVGNTSTASTSVTGNTSTLTKIGNPLKVNSIKDVIFLAVDLAIWVGTAFAVLAIIFVGFKFVFAQGKEKELSEAKQWFFYIIIGLAILISSKVIVEIVKNTLVDSGVVNQGVFNP